MVTGCLPVVQPSKLDGQSTVFTSSGEGWPSYVHTPRHQVPILVTLYNLHELQWDYSFPWSPHGERQTPYAHKFWDSTYRINFDQGALSECKAREIKSLSLEINIYNRSASTDLWCWMQYTNFYIDIECLQL